jgi:hypothetical protein
MVKTVKLRPTVPGAGFLAGVVPGSECLTPDGPVLADDEYARIPTAEERETPLVDLFAGVPQEPLPNHWVDRVSGGFVVGRRGDYLSLWDGRVEWSEDGRRWVELLAPERVALMRELFAAEAQFERARQLARERGE